MFLKFDFSKVKILVIGDVMLDKYYYGSVERISPEAPIPVLKVTEKISSLGGAANVANNIISLTAEALLFGLIGDDFNGQEFLDIIKGKNIENYLLKLDMPTITKSRVVANKKQQIVRLDFEGNLKLDKKILENIKLKLQELLPKADLIIISDYAKGLINKEICSFVIDEAKKINKKVIIDPKKNNWQLYRNAFIITPNFNEFQKAIGANIDNTDAEIELHGRKLLETLNLDYLLVTRSEKGMSLISKNDSHYFRAIAQEVYDVSGAGDTVIGTLAVALAKGFDVYTSCDLANKAAGVVVKKLGTAPITLSELEDTIIEAHEENKIVPIKFLLRKLNGSKFSFIEGSFDSLNRNLIKAIRELKKQTDIVVLGLPNSFDQDILQDKIFLLAALEFIDYITVLEELDSENLIQNLKPDFYYKDTDLKGV